MKNPFKFEKEALSYKSDEPKTPYQLAAQEWDLRLGLSQVQAKNWRFCAVISMLVAVALAWGLIFLLTTHKEKIFIAEVTKEGRIVNVAPLSLRYQPSEAQKEYFVCRFIELVKGLTLDPVAVRKNWVSAFDLLSNRGAERLKTYFKQNNPVTLLGKKTATVQIVDVNPVSNNTIHVDWVETIVNINGQEEAKNNYSGVFTIVVKQPVTREQMLRNPLGIYVVDFNISEKDSLKKDLLKNDKVR